MSSMSSKIDLLYLINQLRESGDNENALRLQKIFLESIVEDREAGRYNIDIQLDRKSKKALLGARTALIKNSNQR